MLHRLHTTDGLRDYGTATWEGGDPGCDHIDEIAAAEQRRNRKGLANNADENDGATRSREVQNGIDKAFQCKCSCQKCGATRVDNQIGLEPTPEAYVAKLVAVFREVKRVLRDDGVLWLNLGDSYAANRTYQVHNTRGASGHTYGAGSTIPIGLKPKDLIGIPWMVAFALRADGWYLRQDIIWSKANPMPESVTDRCTKSHEYIFLLTKSARYYYEAAAIKEPCVYAEPFEERCERAKDNHKAMPTAMKNGIRPRKKTPQTFGGAKARNNEILEGDPRFRNGSEQWGRVYETTGTRNKRSVWNITTQPYKEAHFATFPEEIPRTCILAGSKKGDTILDPFSGAGTTGVVAEKLNRKYIGIELNPQYTKMAEDRIYNVQPLFAGLEL